MSPCIDSEEINALLTLPEGEAYQKLSRLIKRLGDSTSFQSVDAGTRKAIVKLVEVGLSDKPSMFAPVLELTRVLARDKRQLDLILSESVRLFIIHASGLSENSSNITSQVVIEAGKCLINTLFNSSCMRETFEAVAISFLLERITMLTRADYSGRYEWINGVSEELRNTIWLFDLRIAFLMSAHSARIQLEWGNSLNALFTFLNIIRQYIGAAIELEAFELEEAARRLTSACDRAGEAAKVLFNITYKRSEELDEQFTKEITEVVAALIKGKNFSPVMEQHAVNLLATLKMDINVLCPKVNSGNNHAEQYNLCDMSFAQALLDALEKKLDDNNNSDSDLLSTYFGSALKLCTASKEARRYCRLKILPPMVAADVARRPDEGNSLRNKIIRVMMSPAFSKELASEFMFVLCKRSVNRLIKYTGLGHSAGLLANSGLLGQINLPKNRSDSEDSETEDYKAVEDRVNPVTGYLRPENSDVSPFEDMSEEQKEYEAMKLVDAMNKLMNAGVVKPGTIGDDGRPKAVSHVLELVKDIPDEECESDSE